MPPVQTIVHQCAKEQEITEIRVDIGVITERTASMSRKIDDLVHCIKGNGQPGLKTEVALNTDFRKKANWLVALVVAQLITSSGLLIRQVVKSTQDMSDRISQTATANNH